MVNNKIEKELNNILFEIEENGVAAFCMGDSDERSKAQQRLIRLGLIKAKGKYSYDLTNEGQIAVDLGGYNEWVRFTSGKEEKENEIKDLTIKQLKGNIFQMRLWWVIILINVVVSFIVGNFELILKWFK